jgi:hypothetical protein
VNRYTSCLLGFIAPRTPIGMTSFGATICDAAPIVFRLFEPSWATLI